MNMRIALIVAAAGAISICATSCGNGHTEKTTKSDSTATRRHPKMSAKDRLAKNNNLEKHLTWERNKLKGKVQKVTVKEYEIKGKEEKVLKDWNEISYNQAGYKTGWTTYKKDGKPERRVVMMYDARNNDTASYTYLADGTLDHRSVMQNDNHGNEVGSTSYDGKGTKLNWASKFKYDFDDNLVEMSFDRDGNNTFNDKVSYTFDENGFKTGGQSYDSGKLKSTWVCKYDDKGNYLNGAQYNADGSAVSTDTSTYDNEGHKLSFICHKPDGSIWYKWLDKYDNHGNATEVISYNGKNEINEKDSRYYEYVYDATGNATRKTTYKMKDGKKVVEAIEESEYVYY